MAEKKQKTPKSYEEAVQKRQDAMREIQKRKDAMHELKKNARANERASRRPQIPQKH